MPCRYVFTLLAVMCFVPASVAAQSSVMLRATVSQTVTLFVAPSFSDTNVQVGTSGGNTARITLPLNDANDPGIRLPLVVPSNTSFKIPANSEPTAAGISELQVTDVHPTGSL